MNRGLTMIEMLLALVLLSAVVAASASWTTLAGRLGASAAKPMQARNVVESTLALIEDDLVTGDFTPEQDQDATQHFRIRTDKHAMEIDTRAGRTFVYRLDRFTHALERVERTRSSSRARRLASNVSDFSCVIEQRRRMLTVTLKTDDPPGSFTRRYRLP